MAVLEPLRLVIENWEEVFGSAAHQQACQAPVHPHLPALGQRSFTLGKEIWIERSDFEETPPKGFFRLFPGNKVRLKYGYVIECTGAEKDATGQITRVRARLLPGTQSGTPGADSVKVKGVITWVNTADALPAQVRLYDRLFTEEQPDAGGRDFLTALNPQSLRVVRAWVEPTLAKAQAEDRYQFERHGFFVADRREHTVSGRNLVFNRITGLRDSWGK